MQFEGRKEEYADVGGRLPSTGKLITKGDIMNKKLSFSQHKAMVKAIYSPFGTVTTGNGISIATINSLVNAGYLVQDTETRYQYKPTKDGAEAMEVDYQYMLYSQAIDRLDIMEKSLQRVIENKHGYYTAQSRAEALQRVVLAKQVIEEIEAKAS